MTLEKAIQLGYLLLALVVVRLYLEIQKSRKPITLKEFVINNIVIGVVLLGANFAIQITISILP